MFWTITPRELAAHFKGVSTRLAREHDGRAWQAHTTASLGRVDAKRFPRLEKLLSKPDRGQTWQQQRDMAMALTKAFGGSVVRPA